MYSVYVFGSGSSGNCIYVNTGDCKFLLDAGLSFKVTKRELRNIKVRLSDIDYIFASHLHGDHILGLKNIVDKYGTKVICSNATALALNIPYALIRLASDGDIIKLNNLTVIAGKTPHDATGTLNFSFTNSVGEKLLYLTDCGTDDGMDFEEHDVYIIEANYSMDKIMENIQTGALHIVQFNRTTGGGGHLEINQTISILRQSIGERTEVIMLSHLSSGNGNADYFKEKVSSELLFENVLIAEPHANFVYGIDPEFN